MKYVFGLMGFFSFICAVFTGRMNEMTPSALKGMSSAVELSLVLAGAICFWNGIMNVAKEAGITNRLSKLFAPVLCKLFHGMRKGDEALQSISMNISANLLGLGNAATPFGIDAMQRMQLQNANPSDATKNMILFVVMNTASLQIIPTSIASIRMAAGSEHPMEILPALFLTSLCSLFASIIAAKILGKVYDLHERC